MNSNGASGSVPASSSFPAAGADRRAPAIYIITDRRATEGRPLLETLTRALEGAAQAGVSPGTIAIQLREKDLDTRSLVELALALRALTTAFAADLYINDRVDVALAAGADGVHLTGTSMAADDVRTIAPALAVAVSAHGRADLERASRAPNVRFAVLGPIYDTPTKRRFGPPLGLAALAAATGLPDPLPVLAIGGVTVENQGACLAAGAAGIAVIRAILGADDPKKIAFSFSRQELESGRPH